MSVTNLKRIALAAMVCHYIGAFLPGAPLWLQWIGRLSAPLFFYCMAWSLDKTGDKRLYFKRLYFCSVGMAAFNLILSVIVEKTGLVTAVTTNMFASLFAGALFIEFLEYAKRYPKRGKRMLRSFLFWQLAFAGLWAVLYELAGVPYAFLNLASAAVGSALTCEGAFMYVLMGVAFYYTKEDKKKLSIAYLAICLIFFVNSAFGLWGRIFMLLGSDIMVAIMEILTGLVLWGASFRPLFDVSHMLNNDFQWMMIAALPLLLCCNGKKDRSFKYFYYIFYPAHVYMLWFIGTVLMG
ncbi:MAG: hypothetical protein HFH25_02730 [Lachnospiraceae bacterium]|nr:hypothetical protein [Lachnospiraceae bacterium]